MLKFCEQQFSKRMISNSRERLGSIQKLGQWQVLQ